MLFEALKNIIKVDGEYEKKFKILKNLANKNQIFSDNEYSVFVRIIEYFIFEKPKTKSLSKFRSRSWSNSKGKSGKNRKKEKKIKHNWYI